MDQNRKSKMEPAEGSRETALENERMSSEYGSGEQMSSERMRNRESSDDLGSSSDRAMMTGRSSESRTSGESGSGSSSVSSERGSGSSGERNFGGGSNSSGSSSSSRSNSGGISNRELDREQCEQEQLPERGRSQSER